MSYTEKVLTFKDNKIYYYDEDWQEEKEVMMAWDRDWETIYNTS